LKQEGTNILKIKLFLIPIIVLFLTSCDSTSVSTSSSTTTVAISISPSEANASSSQTSPSWKSPQDLTSIEVKKKCVYYKYNQITQYDEYFKKYTKHYMYPGFDFLYLKAQSVAESRLNSDAVSPVGAQGMMQIMPGTWNDIVRKNPSLSGSSKNAQYNIAGGIYYMGNLWNSWKQKYTWIDHWSFCTASYNAGQGHIIKAQSKAKLRNLNTEQWTSIIVTLPLVTGDYSKETITYVSRIIDIRKCLVSPRTNI
jgi:membrane-bound lytic murein transglycosylase F